MFLLLWHSPMGHDPQNFPTLQPSLVRYDDMTPRFDDEDTLILWWALNEQATY